MNLSDIHSPADIKGMDAEDLMLLSARLRTVLINKLAARGGHVGPNLGVVEATVALHYVFDAPKDKIVFDVSHQSYVHKMLTGRIDAFIDPAKYGDVTGYTNPRESDFDLFSMGHTSSSLSLACGLVKARDIAGGDENVVAFIGDASLGGGEALEGLDTGGTFKSNFIVVVNDNQMSIAENHGAVYEALRELRESNGMSPNNIFRNFGYEYLYVREGNDLRELVKAFSAVKGSDRPVVVHINTMKGLGLPVAEVEKEKFHWHVPFDMKSGAALNPQRSLSYPDLFARQMLRKIEEDNRIVVLTAGTPGAIGFTAERRAAAGDRFVDVGIAEQDAVAMAAGIAKGGGRPVFGVMATFLQRAYDQLSQEVAINRLPVVAVTFGTGVFGIPDETHLGFFDIAMISNIPGILLLAPSTPQEFEEMIDWTLEQDEVPVVVRCPTYPFESETRVLPEKFTGPSYRIVEEGSRVAIIAEGGFLGRATKAAALLREEGIAPTVVQARMLSDVDRKVLDSLRGYDLVVTLEDGIVDGGFGQKVASYMAQFSVRTICKGLPKEFLNGYNASDLLKSLGLMPDRIAAEIKERL